MRYSFVIPCYKSSQTIEKVVTLTMEEMEKLGKPEYQFVLVNDASPDGGATFAALRRLAEHYPCVTAVDLAKNAGQHNAIMAGFRYTDGDIIVGMDDDMQTHPSQLGILFDALDEGYDIVYGYYPEKKHSAVRNLASRLNYWSVRVLIGKPKELKTSSFWVMRRFVRDNVITYTHSFTYLQGLFLRTTRNIGCVPIQHFEREVGQSGYTFKKLLRLWSGIMGVSISPLRLCLSIGCIFAGGGILGALGIVIMKLMNPGMQSGWPSLMAGMCFFAGIQLVFLGVVGEYVGRIYLGLNREPQYVIREVVGKEKGLEKDTDSGRGKCPD